MFYAPSICHTPHLVYDRVPSGCMLATVTAPVKLKPTGKNRGAATEVSSQSSPLFPAALLIKIPGPPPPPPLLVSASKASRSGAATEGTDLLPCSSSERLITRAPADLRWSAMQQRQCLCYEARNEGSFRNDVAQPPLALELLPPTHLQVCRQASTPDTLPNPAASNALQGSRRARCTVPAMPSPLLPTCSGQ